MKVRSIISDTSIHNVKHIEVTTQETAKTTTYRKIFITTEDGKTFCICCFGDSVVETSVED